MTSADSREAFIVQYQYAHAFLAFFKRIAPLRVPPRRMTLCFMGTSERTSVQGFYAIASLRRHVIGSSRPFRRGIRSGTLMRRCSRMWKGQLIVLTGLKKRVVGPPGFEPGTDGL